MEFSKQPADNWVQQHRRIWDKKAGLRHYYESQIFDRIISHVSNGRTLQLGSGPGFFSQYFDDMVNTDFGNR